jgi:asparagine synthase (glutamine-hydrolysing)
VCQQLLERATQALAHRGADDHGTVILRESVPEPLEVGLGNRRLAILGLSPLGHQPMQDPATGNWLVHNGEIYNFREVRAKLEKDGVPLLSQSDTEVILKSYARWGEAFAGATVPAQSRKGPSTQGLSKKPSSGLAPDLL